MAWPSDEPDLFTRLVAHLRAPGAAVCEAFDRLDGSIQSSPTSCTKATTAISRRAYDNCWRRVIHLIDPEHAGEYLERACRATGTSGTRTRADDDDVPRAPRGCVPDASCRRLSGRRAAHSSSRSTTRRPSSHACPTPIVAIVKRHSPAGAAVLLGALRAHRERSDQAGVTTGDRRRARYESSLRRVLGDEFEVRHAEGLALDETEMIAHAFAELDAITEAT